MTKDELMQPRYKVIADYPFCTPSIGDILESIPRLTENLFAKKGWQPGVPNINESYLLKYPHLFKKLEWWEDRKPEDMPEYVKQIYTGQIAKTGWDKWGNCFFAKGIATPFNSQIYLLPSTEIEYNEYRLLNP